MHQLFNMKMKTFFSVLLWLLSLMALCQTSDYTKWMQKSMQYLDANKLDSAAYSLQKAMSADPANENNAVLLLNLGIIQRQLQLYDDAYISFTASLNASNNAPLVLHNRASLLVERERFDEAMEDYDLLIKNDAKDVEAYYRRGLLFLEKGDRAKAEADFGTAEKVDANHLFTKLSKALLHKLDGNWSEAEKLYSEIIDSAKETHSVYYLNRAETYLNTGQSSKAAADLAACESNEKANPFFYILRGRLRLEQFDKISAKADFTKAKQMGYDAVIADEWLKKVE